MTFVKALRLVALAIGGAAVALGSLLVTPAEAAPRSRPITCGMVVQETVNLYLAKDLYCPDTALRIGQDNGADDPVVPTVNVDLRGHTLRGPGTGFGVWSNSYPGAANVRITNGVVQNWEYGVAGDSNTAVSGLALINNRYGFFCNQSCRADLTIFRNNETGIAAAGESSATVTRSTFIANDVGATVSSFWTLKIDRSAFTLNKVGVQGSYGRPIVSSSAFVRNDTAVSIITEDPTDPSACADLTRVTFSANQQNLVGPRCTG